MSASAVVTLSVPESLILATNSLPELLACLFDVKRARTELDLLDAAITDELTERVSSEGGSDASSEYPASGRGQKSST
jgi:hypothetical protein